MDNDQSNDAPKPASRFGKPRQWNALKSVRTMTAILRSHGRGSPVFYGDGLIAASLFGCFVIYSFARDWRTRDPEINYRARNKGVQVLYRRA